MARLTGRQKRFVDEYLIDLNATQAAKRAGYSPRSAYSIGYEVLQKNEVKEYLAKRQRDLQKRAEINQDRVLRELATIGFADITDYANIVRGKDGQADILMAETGDLPQEKRVAIASIKQGTRGVEIKLHDKVKALELIGKHLGAFSDKTETDASIAYAFEGEGAQEFAE